MNTFSTPTKVLTISGLVVASVFLVGCSKAAQTVQNKVQDVAQQAQTALLTDADLSKISDPLVRKNLVAQANVRAFETVSTSSEKSAPGTTTDIQINGGTIGMHTKTTIAGNTQEMIMMGDTTYVKDPTDGSWWKQVNNAQAGTGSTSNFKAPSLDEIKSEYTKKQENTTFKSLGTEACGSLTCYKYEETDAPLTEGGAAPVRTFWFDNQDFLTRKDEQTQGALTITNTYSYDNISVSAPSPTKDVPEGHNVYEYMMGAPKAPTTGALPNSGAAGAPTGKAPTKAEIDAMIKQAQDAQKNQY